MDKATLVAAIQNSGGAGQTDDQVDGLLTKLAYLEHAGRYGKLLASVASANNKSNLLAAIFEVTFAFHFERAGLPLEYEVKQDNDNSSSIDFVRRLASGISVYFEARLLQQDNATRESIKEQLQKACFYRIAMNGKDEHDAIVRLQRVILSKVQKHDGTPTKFLRVAADVVNIVVVDVSDLILGTIDVHDCLLSTHGDPAVPEECRRGIFGLFQEPSPEYPEPIQAVAKSYEHIRSTLSGALFLFKARGSGVLDYRLEHYMTWNPKLVDRALAEEVCSELALVTPMRRNRR